MKFDIVTLFGLPWLKKYYQDAGRLCRRCAKHQPSVAIMLGKLRYLIKYLHFYYMLQIGTPAPYFEGYDENGNRVRLSDFAGKKLVLYFYPKDSTPGCTAEACDLRDNYERFIALGYEVLGVSRDSAASHQRFIAKYELPFHLIADTDLSILKAYEAWGKKKMYGKETEGTLRTTYVIDEQGIIVDAIGKVDTKNHTSQVLKG